VDAGHLASFGHRRIAQLQVGSLVSTSTVMTTVSQVDPIKAEFNISELEYLTSAKGNQWAGQRRARRPGAEVVLEDEDYPHPGVVAPALAGPTDCPWPMSDIRAR